jgi:hypothetical protein
MKARTGATVTALIAAVVTATGAGGRAPALETELSPQAVLDAVTLGQSALDGGRAAFHRPYRFAVGRPPLDSVDVVSPFRRVVIAAELRARAGDRRFGQREGLAVAASHPGQLSVHAEFTFHPLNTFVLVPQYRMAWLTRRGGRIEPATTESAPRYGPKTAPDTLPVPLAATPGAATGIRPGTGQPMLGATVVSYFDARRLVDGQEPAVELVIEEAGREELARLPIDLAKMR